MLLGVGVLLHACGAAHLISTNSSCSVYAQKTTHCTDAPACGSCFNAGARAGVLCNAGGSGNTGYYCPVDVGSASKTAAVSMAYACMDWTFQSKSMVRAENSYNARNSGALPVYFGVGTYGDGADPIRGLGACFTLVVEGVDRPLLVQSINTGSDVDGNQFDLQVGDGGAGAYNTCAGSNASMYPGTVAAWGKQYGGADNRAQCSGLPKYPRDSAAMLAAGDDLISLCEASFDIRVRGEGGVNPSISTITRIACPHELTNLTQISRTDDGPAPAPTRPAPSPGPAPGCPGGSLAACIALCPPTPAAAYKACVQSCVARCPKQQQQQRHASTKVADHTCEAGQPGGSLAWCLTRMMDCRKPSGGFKDNVGTLTRAGMKLVQPCAADGYTRIDVQCGCFDCYC